MNAPAPRPRTISGVYQLTERDRHVAKQKSTALRESPRLFNEKQCFTLAQLLV